MTDKIYFQGYEFIAGKTTFSISHGDEAVFRPGGMERWIINYTLEGAGELRIKGKKFIRRRFDLTLFPPGVPHDYITAEEAEDWIHYWAYYTPSPLMISLADWPELEGGIRGMKIPSEAENEIIEAFSKIADYSSSGMPRRKDFAINRLEYIFLFCDTFNPAGNSKTDPRITSSIEFIKQEFRKSMSLEILAEKAGLSPSRFTDLFRKATGIPPLKYLETVRIEHAQRLLVGSNLKICDIAEDCAYSNQYYFSLAFKRVTGVSPSEYRENKR